MKGQPALRMVRMLYVKILRIMPRLIVEQSPYDWEQVEGVGVGIAGFLDILKGIVKFSPNLHFRNVPLKEILEEKLKKNSARQ